MTNDGMARKVLTYNPHINQMFKNPGYFGFFLRSFDMTLNANSESYISDIQNFPDVKDYCL